MKVRFTNDELKWLNDRTDVAARILKLQPDNPVLLGLVKMKHKFTPNASVVFLKVPEQELISGLARQCVQHTVATSDKAVAHAVLKKLEERCDPNS